MQATLRGEGNRRVRCNTETARRIGTYQAENHTETLYRNRDGSFFLHLTGEEACRYGPGGRPLPLTEEQKEEGSLSLMLTVTALDWCKHHLQPCDYDFIFDGMPESMDDETWEQDDLWRSDPNRLTERFTCSLPSGLVRRIERKAEQEKVSKSRIVEQALIRYFQERSDET